jgi:hypothetical protein
MAPLMATGGRRRGRQTRPRADAAYHSPRTSLIPGASPVRKGEQSCPSPSTPRSPRPSPSSPPGRLRRVCSLPQPSSADVGCCNERAGGCGRIGADWSVRGGRGAGPALVDSRRGRAGAADGGAGRHDCEHRAALGPACAGVLQRRPAVGGDGVFAGLRRAAAARRPAVGSGRPAADADHRPGGLRRGVGAGRRGDQLRGAGDRPRRAGGVRGDAGSGRAVDANRDVHRPGRAW